jgi:hypothetical protein
MATQSEAPGRATLEAELRDIDVDDETPGTEPAEDTGEASPPEESEAPAQEEGDQEGQPEAEEGALEEEGEEPTEAAAPTEPVAWKPPQGGTPFQFKVDGKDVPVPGALRYDHGVYIPADSWIHLQRNLADREVIRGRFQEYEQRLEQLKPEHNPTVIQAQETLNAFLGLLDKGPEAVADWLDKFETNRPLLEADVREKTLRKQLENQQGTVSQAETERVASEIAPQLPGYLGQHIEAAVAAAAADYPDLAGQTAKLVEEMWPFANQLFFQADDRDYPEDGVAKGQIGIRRQVLTSLLRQAQAHRAEVKKLQKASTFNGKATGRVAAPPTATTRSRAVPGGKAKQYTPGDPRSVQQFKDDFLSGADEE